MLIRDGSLAAIDMQLQRVLAALDENRMLLREHAARERQHVLEEYANDCLEIDAV